LLFELPIYQAHTLIPHLTWLIWFRRSNGIIIWYETRQGKEKGTKAKETQVGVKKKLREAKRQVQ
jgi:hypothetical protein